MDSIQLWLLGFFTAVNGELKLIFIQVRYVITSKESFVIFMGFFGKPILEKSEKHHFIVTERFYEVTEQDIAGKDIECTFKSKEYSVEIFM